MTIFGEKPLEPVVRNCRFRQGIVYIDKNKPVKILDLGCGPKAQFYQYLKDKNYQILKYVGMDPLVKLETGNSKLETIGKKIKNKLPFENNSFDYVTGLAFLEHLNRPELIVKESIRVLKPSGRAIFTAPSIALKPFLETGAALGFLSKREIAEHKHYFSKTKMLALVPKNCRGQHHYFQMGLNNLLLIEK